MAAIFADYSGVDNPYSILIDKTPSNFIYGCFFGEKECDPDNDFDLDLSQLGACYTYLIVDVMASQFYKLMVQDLQTD